MLQVILQVQTRQGLLVRLRKATDSDRGLNCNKFRKSLARAESASGERGGEEERKEAMHVAKNRQVIARPTRETLPGADPKFGVCRTSH